MNQVGSPIRSVGGRHSSGWKRWLTGRPLGAILVAALFLGSAAVVALPTWVHTTEAAGPGLSAPLAPRASLSTGTEAASHGAGTASPTTVPTASTPAAVANGPATFFNNTVFPNPPPSCANTTYNTRCWNSTSEPSINLTSTGLLVVAYTAFTNITDCPQFLGNGNGTTEVGVRTSSDLGVTWSTPVYLDNPVCTGYDGNFSSAAQPSITSTSNGSLVMAFEEWNSTACTYGPWCYRYVLPSLYSYYLNYIRIVVSRSYDNGVTWTTPFVLDNVTNDTNCMGCNNPGFPDAMPRVAGYGDTVYVAWTNYTDPWTYSASMQVTIRASTDGGITWGPGSTVPAIPTKCQWCWSYTVGTANPDLLVTPNGTLYVSYLTAYNDTCIGSYCGPFGSIGVAWSTDNATTFSNATAARGQQLYSNICCADSYMPSANPSMTYSPVNDELFITWTGAVIGYFCPHYSPGNYNCYQNQETTAPFLATSLDGGTSWSSHEINGSFINPNGGPLNAVFLPAIAVTSDGTLHMEASFLNDSICGGLSGNCGALQEIYLNSTDGGATWSDTILLTSNWSVSDLWDWEQGWPGEYETMFALGDTILLGWTMVNCYTTWCDWQGGPPADTAVVLSELYSGPSITLTFSETGLPAGVPWMAEVMGNVRVGITPATLSVSGIPPKGQVAFSAPWYNQSWGISYSDTMSVTSPASFATNSTVTVTFSEQVLFTITTVPLFPGGWCWSTPGNCNNYAMSPMPGSVWITPGTTESISITGGPMPSYCTCWNLSFMSWTGVGPGNYSGVSQNITFTPTGPVNETANFVVLGYCFWGGTCWNTSYYPEQFVETGLPANVTWGVTMLTQNGTALWNATGAPTPIGFLLPATPTQFFVWTVPDPLSGDYWVPTTDLASPVMPIAGSTVHVTFSLESASSAEFATTFIEQGLPAGTPWTVEVGSSAYGVQSNITSIALQGGGPYTVNGSIVYLENGYAYYASEVSWTSYTFNSSEGSASAPADVPITGPGVVTIDYSPMYLLTTSASVGGSVTPNTNWYAAGTHIQLNETASAGYHFVSWVGSGSGATTATQDATPNPTITPTGPVTEAATFRPNPLPTWNLTVVPVGLPVGTPYLVTIGTMTYAATGTFKVGEISNGNYAVAVPYSYLNGTSTTRFVAGSVTSDLTFTTGGVLEITSNGTLTLSFTTQYLLTLSATPSAGGTISPSPGAYWENASDAVTVTATPNRGYLFAGWNGTGNGLVLTPTTSVTMTAPTGITAQFTKRPIGPPAVFWAKFTETGLPTGVAWNFSLGSYGTAGSNTTLTVSGLNGSYNLSVAYVTISPGVRYSPNVTGVPLTVTSNSSFAVSFAEQFLLVVTSGVGGTVYPAGPTWVNAGGSVTLTALPNGTTMRFENWTGTGTGSYSGPDLVHSLNVTGPVTELATFVSVVKPTTQTQNSGTGGMGVALGLMIGLLVVGVVAGILIGRRRMRGPVAEAEWQELPTEETGGAVYSEGPETKEEPP